MTTLPPMSTHQLLMIEDDVRLAQMVSDYLGNNGLEVTHMADGKSGLEQLQPNDGGSVELPDLVILDLMLPDMDGLEVCRRIRSMPGTPAQVPVLMLTAKGDPMDRIIGLELGADDYMSKPFEPRELVARIQTILRRVRDDRTEQRANIRFDNWRLNSVLRQLVADDGLVVPLSNAEFRLLWVFIERPRRVLSREQLLDAARGRSIEAFDRSIDLLVSRLRQKLGDDPKAPQLIKTVRGEGYLFDARDIG